MDNTPSADTARLPRSSGNAVGPQTAFLVLDTESVPDGRLIQQVKYPTENLTPEEAVARAQEEARRLSPTGSDFLPVTYQVPVAVCVLSVARDLTLQKLTCLDVPHYRSEEMTRLFWKGVAHYHNACLVTFNGRGFDLPLLELSAFRHGVSLGGYFQKSRGKFNNNHLDLQSVLSNYGASRVAGGLNLLAKLAGAPGKMAMAGDQVYGLYREGRVRDINDYCMFDTLDTYFVFLRMRVLGGELELAQEKELLTRARAWLEEKAADLPALRQYLDNWKVELEVPALVVPREP